MHLVNETNEQSKLSVLSYYSQKSDRETEVKEEIHVYSF